jgi:hypothetical protein
MKLNFILLAAVPYRDEGFPRVVFNESFSARTVAEKDEACLAV